MRIKAYIEGNKIVFISKEYLEEILEDISKIKLSYDIKCHTFVDGSRVFVKGSKIALFDLLFYLQRHYFITLE